MFSESHAQTHEQTHRQTLCKDDENCFENADTSMSLINESESNRPMKQKRIIYANNF